MSITVVLAVGLDPWVLFAKSSTLKSAGYIVIPADTLREAVNHFKSGDFDVVLLGESIPTADQEKLTSLVRSSGPRTPVVRMSDTCGAFNSFADATPGNESSEMLAGIRKLLLKNAGDWAVPRRAPGYASSDPF